MLELNVLRVRDALAGDTPQERFDSFVAHFASRGNLGALLAEYPVLARLLAQCCEQAVTTHLELLRRLASDRDLLIREMFRGHDPGPLAEVRMGGVGDGHQGGRSVGLLRFADGTRLAYKPRPIGVHTHFNDVLAWLNERWPGLDLRALTVLDRPHGQLGEPGQQPRLADARLAGHDGEHRPPARVEQVGEVRELRASAHERVGSHPHLNRPRNRRSAGQLLVTGSGAVRALTRSIRFITYRPASLPASIRPARQSSSAASTPSSVLSSRALSR
ncbi:hypothetical protein GCM10022224_102550 [Nonomuraea antimicrobica]|uniref:Lantibiotic biosynthesis protein dehydration domain-containing protein n=1 Tax=Nonomuraea antimicrobica TaxID=561173 RepID=A0ABP7EKF6_9ACTN